jgi:cysteine-rich repeat protein
VTGDDEQNLSLPTLLTYDAVLFFTNGWGDPVANGNVLADYADTGRPLVLATFSWANQGQNTHSGRIIEEQISPFLPEGSSLYTDVTMQSNDGSAFFDGVNTLGGFFHDNVMLSQGATLRGTWSDGEPLLAQKGNVIGVNLFPVFNATGDYQRLFANTLIGKEQCDDGNTVAGDGCDASCDYE